jgi:cellulose biosynthesis protein BcsQ/ActR/RegA family two-component response regulator
MVLRVFLVDGDFDWADSFTKNAYSSDKLTVVGIEQGAKEASELIYDQNPSLLIIDESADNGNGLATLEKLTKEFKEIPAIFTVRYRNVVTWRSARAKGAIDVLYKDYTINDVLDAASKVIPNHDNVEEEEEEVPVHSGKNLYHKLAGNYEQDNSRFQRVVKTEEGGRVVRQEVVTVYSPKGGVGKTTIAANIAVAIARNKVLKLNVVLVDLDVSFGNAETVLNLESDDRAYTVLDWDNYQVEAFDRKLIDQLVIKHPSGLHLIPAPKRAEDAARINKVEEDGTRRGEEIVSKVIRVLRNYYDVIIIDVGPSLREDSTITAMWESNRILLIGTADVPTLRNIMSCQETFDNVVNIDQSKIRMLINRVSKGFGVDMRSISEVIPYMIIGKIPEDSVVQKLTNYGKLPVIDAPNSAFSEAILKVCNNVVPVFPKENKKPGFFARLFGIRSAG